MKVLVKVLTFLLIGSSLYAQEKPAYERFPTVPPFELLATDSTTILKKDQLKKNQPVIVMYFSPDCDHCQHQTEDILGLMDKIKGLQLVMASYQPMELIRDFKTKYKLENYPNVMIGRDTKYFIPSFFGVTSLPYLAFYDRKGNLMRVHEGNVKPNNILKLYNEK